MFGRKGNSKSTITQDLAAKIFAWRKNMKREKIRMRMYHFRKRMCTAEKNGDAEARKKLDAIKKNSRMRFEKYTRTKKALAAQKKIKSP